MKDILNYIPQRPPFVMVDEFLGMENNVSRTSLTIREDNLFVDEGLFSECGLIEHIAQSAAARAGYLASAAGLSSGIGYIGSVEDLTVIKLPSAGDTVETYIAIVKEVMNVTLIQARCLVHSQEAATCRMKIFLKE
jgi:predicted hotdog family 3-hydroxylacyl-ACP dehydratase